MKIPDQSRRSHNSQKKEINKQVLDRLRLGGSQILPKGFKPFSLKGMKTEEEVIAFLQAGADRGDADAQLLIDLLKVLTVNDLIVEGAIRLEK